MWTVISINWTVQPLSGEQMLVLRNVAALHLRKRKKQSVVNFKHALCEGQLTRKKEGSLGTFSGTIFEADLGALKGERWTAEILIPRNSEWIPIEDDSVVIMTRPIPGGDFGVKQVDTTKTVVVDKSKSH